MIYSLTWLPMVLEGAGLKVALVDGWAGRGRSEMGRVEGVICHHTAGPRTNNMPSLGTLIKGRSDLPGPLAQLGLGRDGTYYVIAAGKCNHAGAGQWRGFTNGNLSFIGIEAENAGTPADFPWPDVQMDSYRRGVAAILQHIGHGPEFCAGHREYALPVGRKNDPLFDMDTFRAEVAAIMNGSAVPSEPIPSVEPAGAGRPTLRRGAFGDLVRDVQTRCDVEADGVFGAQTEAAVRHFQREHALVPDGIVGPKTWAAFDAIGPRHLNPDRRANGHANSHAN
jgi:peptidoglycan hydrolase-like protein with peptidoglycan-binding domain